MFLARHCIAPHLWVLRLCGFCRLDQSLSPVARSAHELYRFIILITLATYLLQEVVYSYQMRSNMNAFSKVMFLLLCHITSLVKQVVFHIDAVKVDKMINNLNDPLYNNPAQGTITRYWSAREKLEHTAKSALRLLCVYSGIAVITCILWILFPIIYRIQGLHFEFAFWTGVDYDSSKIIYSFVVFYSYAVTTLVAIGNTTMDAFMGTTLHQCKTQISILRENLENLTQRAKEVRKLRKDENYETVLVDLFIESLKHYEKIKGTVALLISLFGGAILVQFTIGGWILCMAAYKINSLQALGMEFMSMILFISCILTELLLYCYYGNEVTVESSRLRDSLYAVDWLDTPLKFKRCLLITMICVQNPIEPVVGGVLPLSLETYLKVLKSSYTFYAVLRQTK